MFDDDGLIHSTNIEALGAENIVKNRRDLFPLNLQTIGKMYNKQDIVKAVINKLREQGIMQEKYFLGGDQGNSSER